MKNTIIDQASIDAFLKKLLEDEKSASTVEKYLHIAAEFCRFAEDKPITKELTVAFKRSLTQRLSPRTVNVYIAGVNKMLCYMDLAECAVKSLKIQRQVYLAEERELTKKEYNRLLSVASPKLRLIMETICSTGIRVSELQYFTREAVECGIVTIRIKGKCREILISGKL